MTEASSNPSGSARELWVSLSLNPHDVPSSALDCIKKIAKHQDSKYRVEVPVLVSALSEICRMPDPERRHDIAKSLLKLSGPLLFDGEPWNSPLNAPLLSAMQAQDERLIKLFHENGAVLKKDDALSVGRQLGNGFWCLPELVFPAMQDTADLYGFVYQIMDRRKSSQQDMDDTVQAIHAFAQWANPDSLPARITDAACAWQARRGNAFYWITGNREYQMQTLAALINVGLDVEQAMQYVKMNNAQSEKERRDMYREAVAYALSSATPPATGSRPSPRL